MNGHPRDTIGTDLAAGRPTLSPSIDPLLGRVMALQSRTENERLLEQLDYQVSGSSSLIAWAQAPERYLSAFDPATTVEIEHRLLGLFEELRLRASERGWELDADGPSHDIAER